MKLIYSSVCVGSKLFREILLNASNLEKNDNITDVFIWKKMHSNPHLPLVIDENGCPSRSREKKKKIKQWKLQY